MIPFFNFIFFLHCCTYILVALDFPPSQPHPLTIEQRDQRRADFWRTHKPCATRETYKDENGKKRERNNIRRKCAFFPHCPKETVGTTESQLQGDKWCASCNQCLHWECFIAYHVEKQHKEGSAQLLPYNLW